MRKTINKQMFAKKYADVFKGDAHWRKISVKGGLTYAWDRKSTYVQNPPYFVGMERAVRRRSTTSSKRAFSALFLDSITTDHISPAGSIKLEFSGRQISDRAQGQAGRFQPVRHAARQSRSDDARHLRQHPAQEPDGAWRRGRLDDPLSVGRADVDLRSRDALQDREGPAGGVRRQGIRHRLVARLGRQGRQSCSASARWSGSHSSGSIAPT